MFVREIAIIGLGLIGGSLGKALKKRQPKIRITGMDVKTEVVETAQREGIIDTGTTSLTEKINSADLIFLAVPIQVMLDVCRDIIPFLKEGAIITDVCSIKESVAEMMEELLPPQVSFIGGHPMAGSEKWGLEGVNELLFENAAYILTPTYKTNEVTIKTVKQLVESLGARVVFLSPEEHDRKVAAVSHLPHLIASALMNTVGSLEARQEGYLALAGGGLRDTTRIAASNSEMWCNILIQNHNAVLPLLQEFNNSLVELERAIQLRSPRTLGKLLVQANVWRSQVPSGMKSILPELYEISISVPDQPGMIGEICSLLGKYAINIIDIEIQRVREGEAGAIRLGFTEDETRSKALHVLEKHGYNARS